MIARRVQTHSRRVLLGLRDKPTYIYQFELNAHVKYATLDLYYGADATQILEIKKNGFIDPQSRHISPRAKQKA